MEESQDILLNSIASSGVRIPPGFSSVKDLTPATLLSISSQSLHLIDRQNSPFPASLPENSVTDRLKLCSELASSFKTLGFVGDISFHKMNCKTESLQDQKKILVEKSVSSSVELQELEEKLDLLKAVVQMTSDHNHSSEFYVNQLNDQVEVKRDKIVEMESHWIDKRKALEQKKDSLEVKLSATEPETYAKYKKVEEIELKLECILAEKKRREDELILLSVKAEKQPKLQPRRTYIQRVEEITKNSRKQDVDLERILKQTRELQLEINSVQERLNRTHAVVDETVFREAKKDQVGQQAYRLLTNIHDNFEQIAENLLATDRARRKVTDYEGKLATMVSRSVDTDKLKEDLDTIRRENDLLEKKLSKDSSQSVG